MDEAKPTFSQSEIKKKIEQARKRFEAANEAEEALRAASRDDRKFAIGNSENGYQWNPQILKQRQAELKPCLTINKTQTHIELIVSAARQNPPAARVLPAKGGGALKSAEWMGGLVRNIEAQSNAESAYITAYQHAVAGGLGFWHIDYEYESPESFDYKIVFRRCPDPDLVLLDNNRTQQYGADAKWGFVFEDVPKETFKERYKIDPSDWQDSPSSQWVSDETVRVANYYFLEETPDEIMFMPDGSKLWKSQNKDRETEALKSRKSMRQQWHCWKLGGVHDEYLEASLWPGKYCPIVEVVGNEEIIEGKKHRYGHTRSIKDPARMYNYWSSEATTQVALQNHAPYIGPAEAFAGYEKLWQTANNRSVTYLPYNAFNDNGDPIPAPNRQQPAQMSTALVQGMQNAAMEFSMASGQYEAQFGARSNESSGVAINARKMQSETTTYKYADNLSGAITHSTRIVIDLIQKLFDTEKVARMLGVDGKEGYIKIDPSLKEVTKEQANPITQEIERLFNPQLGEYEVVASSGPSYQTQRQAATDAMGELTRTMPLLGQAAPDLIVGAMDFPGADKIAARLKKTLPPGMADDEESLQDPAQKIQTMTGQMQQGQQMLQQMQQQMQEMQAQLQQADQELQAKESEIQQARAVASNKDGELQLKAQEIEIKMQELQLKAQEQQDRVEIERIKADASIQQAMLAAPKVPEPQEEQQVDNSQEASAIQQLTMVVAAAIEQAAKPKRSLVRIAKDETGAYVGEKIEVPEEEVTEPVMLEQAENEGDLIG